MQFGSVAAATQLQNRGADRGPQAGSPLGVVDRGPQAGSPLGVVDRVEPGDSQETEIHNSTEVA